MKILAFLRSSVFWIVIAITIIIGEIAFFAALPFSGYKTRYWFAKQWSKTFVSCMKWICGVDYSGENVEVLEKDEPTILLCKHQSGWEALGLIALSPRRICFVYQSGLHKIPIFGWGLARLGMFSIDRSRGREAFEQIRSGALQHLKDGWILTMFPEGTRTPPGVSLKYKSGGSRIAVETGASVVPAALNSWECWPKHSRIAYPGKIRVVFGDRISSKGKTPAELNKEVENWIEGEMRRISPQFYTSETNQNNTK